MSSSLAGCVARGSSRARWVGLCCLLALAACSSSTPHAAAPSPSTSSASSTPSATLSSDPNAAIRPALLSAYAATYTDVETAVREGSIHSPALARHAIPPAEYELQGDVEQYLKLGVVPVGVPELHARVTSINLSANPQQAVLAACPGAPRLVDIKTGGPITSHSLPPNPFTVTLQTLQGRWVVSYFKVDRSKTCSA